MRMLLILTLVAVLAGTAQAQAPYIADFEGGVNYGDWTWGATWADVVEPTGGNPGGYFGNAYQDTYYPVLRSGWDVEGFTGDYVAMGVNHISADFQTFSSSNQWIGTFMFCVFLRNNMGTPDDFEDDIYVYPNPENWTCPDIGEGWKHYDFDIPSDFVGAPGELPDGWMGGSYLTGNATFPSDATWQDVIAGVSRLEFWWNHPDWAAIFASFNTGVDNIVLEYSGPVATEDASFGDVKALYR